MTGEDRSFYYPGGRTGILLIHGLGGTPLQMRYVARALARSGYSVHCPQLAGHCSSLEDLRNSTWNDWYGTCEKAFKRLQGECDQVIVGGLSGGSLLALNLAAEYPDEILGVTAYAPPLKLDGWGIPWYARFFDLIQHRWFADLMAFDEREPFGIKDVRLRAMVTRELQSGNSGTAGSARIPGAMMMEFRWLSKAVRRKLAGITKPVLIMHPREDDRASLKSAAYLQQHLGGMVETVVLSDSYHVVTMDRQRDLVVDRTVAFADALSPNVGATVQPLRATAAE